MEITAPLIAGAVAVVGALLMFVADRPYKGIGLLMFVAGSAFLVGAYTGKVKIPIGQK